MTLNPDKALTIPTFSWAGKTPICKYLGVCSQKRLTGTQTKYVLQHMNRAFNAIDDGTHVHVLSWNILLLLLGVVGEKRGAMASETLSVIFKGPEIQRPANTSAK
jgi:hypothetical protein